MKTILYIQIILIAFLFSACTSANYYVKQGNYPAAIDYAVQKFRKKSKKSDKNILALEQAWKIENTRILDRVEFLKLDGSPESWVEIHDLYNRLDSYQKAVKPFLPLFIKKEFRNAEINLINVDQELVDAKQKAAGFLYAKGEALLSQNTKFAARDAFAHFQKVKDYYGTYQDLDNKLTESFEKGQNHILIGYSNHSQMIIPQSFMDNLSQYDERALGSTWTKYHRNPNDRTSYDYLIEVHIANINIGPEQIINNSYVDKKQIQDGFEYVLDANGNVAKDSLGNDVKEPAYKEIIATVYRSEQTKVGTLNGVVEYKRADGSVFQSFPFQENLLFKNFFATFQGNRNALSKESLSIVGGQGLPFPSDLQMVMDASEIIKGKTFGLIQGNQQLVVN